MAWRADEFDVFVIIVAGLVQTCFVEHHIALPVTGSTVGAITHVFTGEGFAIGLRMDLAVVGDGAAGAGWIRCTVLAKVGDDKQEVIDIAQAVAVWGRCTVASGAECAVACDSKVGNHCKDIVDIDCPIWLILWATHIGRAREQCVVTRVSRRARLHFDGLNPSNVGETDATSGCPRSDATVTIDGSDVTIACLTSGIAANVCSPECFRHVQFDKNQIGRHGGDRGSKGSGQEDRGRGGRNAQWGRSKKDQVAS